MTHIRHAESVDAASLLDLFWKLDHETDFMLFAPDERHTSLAEQKAILERFHKDQRSIYLIAKSDEQIVEGFCVVTPGTLRRNQHTASLVMGIQKSSWGKGIGSRLMAQALVEARHADIRRIELTVRTDNLRAVALYKKFGFTQEGKRLGSLIINDQIFDEYYMARTGIA